MRHDKHCPAFGGELPHNLKHLNGKLRVKRRCRLIKINDLRLRCDRPRDGNPLLLTTGKLIRIVIIPVGKPYFIKCCFSDLHCLPFWHLSGYDQPLCHIFKSRLVGKQIKSLKDKCCLLADRRDLLLRCFCEVNTLPVKDQFPLIGMLQEIDTAKKRCLARTTRS